MFFFFFFFSSRRRHTRCSRDWSSDVCSSDLERAGAVATITLNRPEARNALDFVMRGELAAVLDEIEADEAARVVILTGAGGHFCSGGDVKTMRAKRHTAAEGRARVESLNRMVLRLVDFPKPTIAMVDGYAVRAGA